MMSRTKRLGSAVLCMVPLLMATSGPAVIEAQLVCSFARAIECASDLTCEPPVSDRTPATFLHVDLDQKAVTLLAPEERRGEVTAITGMQQLDDRVVLSGIERDRAWSAVILEDGTMSVTIAADGSGFVVFGQCMPADHSTP